MTTFVKNVFAIENSEKNSFQSQSHEAFYFTKKSLRIEIPRIVGVVLFLVLSGFFMTAKAQKDQLTTQAGEQIRCKILDETPTRFVYAYLRKDGKVLRNEIFKSLVTEFKYNFYDKDLVDSKGRLIPLGEAVAKKDNGSESKEAPRKEATKEDAKVASNKKASDSQKAPSKPDESAAKVNEKANSSKTVENTPTKTEAPQKEEKKTSGGLFSKKSSDTKKVEPTKTEEKVAVKPEAQTTEEKKSGKDIIAKKPNDTKKEDSRSSEASKVAKTDEKNVAKATETPKNQSKKQSPPRPSAEQKQEDAKAEKPVLENELEKTKDQQKAIAAESPLTAQPTTGLYKNYLKFRVGARGGFASLLTKTPLTDEYSKYKQGLESGWMFGADAAFFPVHNFGIGVMYTNFQSSNDSKSIKYPSIIDAKDATGAVSDKTSTKLLAGVLYYRRNIDFKTFIIFGLAPGMNLYSDKRTEGVNSYAVSGKQFGGAATLGVDFLLGNDIIGRDIILSVEGGYNYAKFDKLDYGKGEVVLPKPQDNSHWSVTIGLRFTRYPKYLRLTSY